MKPRRPRDAATLILVHSGKKGPEILMGRRPDTARFMPGMFVFPGGGVDSSDRIARPATPLDPVLERRRGIGRTSSMARALAMAAIRETVEETGLMLVRSGDVGTPVGDAYLRMKQAGVAPALGSLRYLGRAITPVSRPIRFHARFFVASAEGLQGQMKPNEELEEVDWVPLAQRNKVPLPIVTLFMLERFAEVEGNPERLRPDRPTPLYAWRSERERVIVDHV